MTLMVEHTKWCGTYKFKNLNRNNTSIKVKDFNKTNSTYEQTDNCKANIYNTKVLKVKQALF
jgi:hypothetical protein